MVVCPVIRASLSLCLLLCTLPVVASSSAFTSWTADCGDGIKGNGCILKDTGCRLSTELAMPENVSYAEPPSSGTSRLTITPVFTGVIQTSFLDRTFCTEDRWYPRLNITWGTDLGRGSEQRRFFVSIRYRPKFGSHLSQCEQCFILTVNKKNSQTQQVHQQQELTLSSKDLVQCEKGKPPAHLYVRVHALEQRPSYILEKRHYHTQEASISLPIDKSEVPLYGLPTQYRDLVPVVLRNMSTLNPGHWTSPLRIHNSSCFQTITVQFQIIPENPHITSYTVYLKSNTSHEQWSEVFQPGMDDTVGNVTFYNLTADIYYIQLNISDTYNCPSRMEAGIVVQPWVQCSWDETYTRCILPTSGYVTILDSSFCKITASSSEANQAVDSGRMVAVCLGTGAVVPLCLALLLARYRVKKTTQAIYSADRPLSRKRLLMLYCMDNKHHMHAVLQLANFLHAHAFCDVIIDEWDARGVHEVSVPTWLRRNLHQADIVVMVGSEGADRLIKARRTGTFWPALEREYPFSSIFPMAVTMLEKSSPPTSTKLLSVTLEYTNTGDVSNALEEVTWNSPCYRLVGDLGKMLQYVHDGSGQREEFRARAARMLDTAEGRRLLAAIECAKEFHESDPDWFTNKYGQSETIPSHNVFTEINDAKIKAPSKLFDADKVLNGQSRSNKTNAVYIKFDNQDQSSHSTNALMGSC